MASTCLAGLMQERGQTCPLALRQRGGLGNKCHDVVVQGSGVAPPIVLDVCSPEAQPSAHAQRRQIAVTDKPGETTGVHAEARCHLGAGQNVRRGKLGHSRSRGWYGGAGASVKATRYDSRWWPGGVSRASATLQAAPSRQEGVGAARGRSVTVSLRVLQVLVSVGATEP
jgi:hypothetical protein